MILIKIENEYYLLSDGHNIREGEYICDVITKEVYKAKVDSGLIKYCYKVLASTNTDLDFMALIDWEQLQDHFLHHISRVDVEGICYKAVMGSGKWNHLPDKVSRPNPTFFWNEVDFMIKGYKLALSNNANRKWTDEDMIKLSKYGYEFRDTTSFPEHKFEDACINNTKQLIQSLQETDGFIWDMEGDGDGCYLSEQNSNEKECYRGCKKLKPKIDNGFVNIIKIN